MRLNLRSENDIVKRLHLRDRRFLTALQVNRDRYFQKRTIHTGTKEREICAPCDPLKHFLRQFNAVLRTLPTPPECYGGVMGRSIKDNAGQHMNRRFVMNLDIQDFFPSVTTAQVTAALQRHGCFSTTSELLANLVTVGNELPQGFNTSSLLSIQVLTPVVEELRAFLGRQGIRFTVWIDDITVSSNESPESLVSEIARICGRHGFTLNTEKYHCGEQGVSVQEVTGIVINGNVLRPGNGFIKKTEKMIYTLERYGLNFLNAAFDRNFRGVAKALGHIDGRLTWIREFTPEKAKKLRVQLNGYLVKNDIRKSIKRVLAVATA